MKRHWLASIRELIIKTTMWSCYRYTRMTKTLKMLIKPSIYEDVEQLKLSCCQQKSFCRQGTHLFWVIARTKIDSHKVNLYLTLLGSAKWFSKVVLFFLTLLCILISRHLEYLTSPACQVYLPWYPLSIGPTWVLEYRRTAYLQVCPMNVVFCHSQVNLNSFWSFMMGIEKNASTRSIVAFQVPGDCFDLF
jgi:hypothetical protein